MILTELTALPAGSLPFHTLKEHLRLGTGFAEADLQDGLLETVMRASIAALEARLGVVFLNRQFSWQLSAWRDGRPQILPKRPAQSLDAVMLIDASDQETAVDIGDFVLRRDNQNPSVEALGCFPAIQTGGVVDIQFTAGFGDAWSDVPADLAQAMILLAAHFYENRNGSTVSDTQFPPLVLSLIAPFQKIRGLRG
ncbi:MAG: head-tail connector protein [Pseudomonadota bacterium]